MRFLPLVTAFSLISAAYAFAAPAVQTVETGKGKVIAADNGMTLYTYKKDEKGESYCYDKCATNWPPYLAEGSRWQPAATIRWSSARMARSNGLSRVCRSTSSSRTRKRATPPETVSERSGMPHAPDQDAGAKGASPPSADTFENQILSLVPSLRRYSRSLAKSDSDGEDLLQDCVEKVLVRRSQWRGVNLRAWAFTIMTNLYRDRHRRVAQHPSVEFNETLGLTADDVSGDPLEKTRLPECAERVDRRSPLRPNAGRHRRLWLSGCRRHAGDPDRHRHVPPLARPPANDGASGRQQHRYPAETEMTEDQKPVTEADLHAYVDGFLDAERRQAVERWLNDHPQEADEVRHWQAQAADLQAAFSGYAQPEDNDGRLLSRARTAPPPSTVWRRSALIAASLLLFVSGAAAGIYGERFINEPGSMQTTAGQPARPVEDRISCLCQRKAPSR